MSDFLARLGAASRRRVAAARAQRPEAALLREARAQPPALQLVLDRFDLIAELKLRSPAAGGLAAADFDRDAQLRAYAEGGAAAVSVLTEPDEFLGSLDHMSEAAKLLGPLGCPVMRKDFLTDTYQLLEARAHGAGGALLIVALLDDAMLAEMIACARELGLFLLLEAFDAADLERIAHLADGSGGAETATPQLLAGVNCRNLRTLDVDFGRFAALAGQLPAGMPAVAESGIGSSADIATVARLGYRLALVGSALMRSAMVAGGSRLAVATGTVGPASESDPAGLVRAAVAEFVAAGRSA